MQVTPSSDESVCKNCGLNGMGNFCGNCGESYQQHRITLQHIIHEAVHFFTHFDKGFPYTLKKLIVAPGTMQKDYIDGKRRGFQTPFSMFFLCGTFAALGLYWINHFAYQLHHATENEQEIHFYQHYFALLQMALCPVYALINRWVYYNSKYNYAEFLVILLYNTSLIMLVVLFAACFKLIFGPFEVNYVEMAFVLLYNLITYFNIFNQQSRWLIGFKVLLTSAMCFAVAKIATDVFIAIFINKVH